MKRAIMLTGVAAATVNANFGGGDWGDWGDRADWSKNSDCVKSCITDWSAPDAIISSVCPTGTITAGPSKPTLVSCLESACSDWFPASKWDSVSSKVGDACSSWSSCKTGSGAKTYTLSYDSSWWSGKDWTPTKTADVVTFTGCPGGWDSFIPGGWPGWGGDWDGSNDGDGGKGGDNDGDWKDYCDDKGEWSSGGIWSSGWSSGYSYSCVSVTSTVTKDSGAISTIITGSPATFLAAAPPTTFFATATTTGSFGGDDEIGDDSSQTIPPAGAAATAAVGVLAGAIVGVAMIIAV